MKPNVIARDVAVDFEGLQHQYAPVQIRSAPLFKPQKSSAFEVFFMFPFAYISR